MTILIESPRLTLRKIDPSKDNLESYLSWLRDIENNRFIESARVDFEMDELKNFIVSTNRDADALLLGIFLKKGGDFIGTLKVQPLNQPEKPSWLGMMIGNPNFRGLGYGRESLQSILGVLFNSLGVNEVYLGVDLKNLAAISLYESVGFREFEVEKARMIMKKTNSI